MSILKNLESTFGFRTEEPGLHSGKGKVLELSQDHGRDHPHVKNEAGGARWHRTRSPSSQVDVLIKALRNNPSLALILDCDLPNKQGS